MKLPTLSISRGCQVTLAICLALAASPASAYVTFGKGYTSKWGDDVYAGSGAVVTWGFMADGTDVYPNTLPAKDGVSGSSSVSTLRSAIDAQYGAGSFNAAIENALSTWSAVANITFIGPKSDGGLPAGSPNATTPDIRIGAFHPAQSTYFALVGAVSYGPPGIRNPGGDQFPESGDLFLNLDGPGTFQHFQIVTGIEDVTPINYQYGNDLQELVLHELGHGAIGLGHPPHIPGETVDQRVMYVYDGDQDAPPCCQTLNHELSADDIAGAQFVYGIRGDYNRDSRVDAADYTIWRDTLGEHPQYSGDGADGNVDGVVNVLDYDVWNANFGTVGAVGVSSPPADSTIAAAPEPSSLALLLLSAAILFIVAHRRRLTAAVKLCVV
ncbi:MAG TPA: PEP-CTERM sorting domain-containing protein [Lacipirellulaceae bacterium]|jgi:hypothetical protein